MAQHIALNCVAERKKRNNLDGLGGDMRRKDRQGCASGVEEATVAVAVAKRKREAVGHHFQWREAASQRHLGLGHLLSLVHLELDGGMAKWGFDLEPVLILESGSVVSYV